MKRVGKQFIGLLPVWTLIFALQAEAAEDSVILQGKENQVFATLELADQIMADGQKEPREDAVSLQLSFQVETTQGDAGKTEAAFVFAEDTGQRVHSYRYHKDTGILTIYVSGEKNLFQGDILSLGQVVVNSSGEYGATAAVHVVEDSLRVVNSAGDMQKQTVNAPGRVTCSLGNGGVPPEEIPEIPVSPEEPSEGGNTAGEGSQGGGNPSGGGWSGGGVPSAGISGGGSAAASAGNVIRRKPAGAEEKPGIIPGEQEREEAEEPEQTKETEAAVKSEDETQPPKGPNPFFLELKANTGTDMLLYAGIALGAVVLLAAATAAMLVMRNGYGRRKRKKRRRKHRERRESPEE